MGKQKTAVVSQKTQKRLLQVARSKGSPYSEIVPILYYTGMHPSCLHTLTQDNVDDGILKWRRSKTKKWAFANLQFNSDLDQAVQKWVEREGDVSRRDITRFLKEVGQEAGAPNISAMSFRHTRVYNLLREGKNPAEVAKIMVCSTSLIYKVYGMMPDAERM